MDREAFAKQVISQTDRMYRVAWSMLHSNEDCRDAMQEAALRAWEKRHSLRQEQYFATWLMRILINECRNIQRKRRPVSPLEALPEPAAPAADPALAMALDSLPEKLRLPLVLHAVEGMTYAQTAKVLHLPVSTVTGRIRQARLMMRKELTP